MSSPSRIPRPKVCISRKQEEENVQQTKSSPRKQDNKIGKFPPEQVLKKSIKNDMKTNPTQVQAPKKSIKHDMKTNPSQVQAPKKSPSRVLTENKFRLSKREEPKPTKTTTLHDRRGISEIKKCEKNLRLALEAMENGLESLKHDLDAIKYEVTEKDQDIADLKQNESLLKKSLVNLQKEDEIKAEVLERMNCDPITGETFSAQGLASVAEKKQKEKLISAKFLLQRINDMKTSLSEIQNRLDSKTC